jgi:hypothetical protein
MSGPQAFTHLALISAAFDLDRRLSAWGPRGVTIDSGVVGRY